MPIPFLFQLVIGVLVMAVAYSLMPKQKQPKPPQLEDFEAPTAEPERRRPVVWGSIMLKSPNILSTHDKKMRSRDITP